MSWSIIVNKMRLSLITEWPFKSILTVLIVGILLNLLTGVVFGWPASPLSFALSFMIFLVSSALIDTLIKNRWLPEFALRSLDRRYFSSSKEMLQVITRFVIGYPILAFGFFAVLHIANSVPSVEGLPEIAQIVYQTLSIFGIIYLMASTLWNGLRAFSSGDKIAVVIHFFERSVLLILAMMAVRSLGVEITQAIELIQENPDSALSIVTAIIILNMVVSIVRVKNFNSFNDGSALAGKFDISLPRKVRSGRDIYRTAVHEAGHLLLFGTGAKLPADLTVTVLSAVGPQDRYRGWVHHSEDTPEVLTETHLYWLMLMNLAGNEAELVVFGERSAGADSDNSSWINVATVYLSCGFGEIFYSTPEDESHRAHNRAVLNDLKFQCMHRLREFLQINRELLEELATIIADTKNMDRAQLEPYLMRVFAEGMPLRDFIDGSNQ